MVWNSRVGGGVKNEIEFQGGMTSENGYPQQGGLRTVSGKAHWLALIWNKEKSDIGLCIKALHRYWFVRILFVFRIERQQVENLLATYELGESFASFII